MLMNMRQYPQAADFLEAGAAGDDAARTLGLATMLRGAQHHEDMKFGNTPSDMVKRFALVPFASNMSNDLIQLICSAGMGSRFRMPRFRRAERELDWVRK